MGIHTTPLLYPRKPEILRPIDQKNPLRLRKSEWLESGKTGKL